MPQDPIAVCKTKSVRISGCAYQAKLDVMWVQLYADPTASDPSHGISLPLQLTSSSYCCISHSSVLSVALSGVPFELNPKFSSTSQEVSAFNSSVYISSWQFRLRSLCFTLVGYGRRPYQVPKRDICWGKVSTLFLLHPQLDVITADQSQWYNSNSIGLPLSLYWRPPPPPLHTNVKTAMNGATYLWTFQKICVE